MRLGVFLKIFAHHSWPEVLDAVCTFDISWVHFTLQVLTGESLPRTVDNKVISNAAKELELRRLQIASFSGTFNMAHPDPSYRGEYLKRFETACRACHDLGGQIVSLCTGTRDPHDMWRKHPDNQSPQAWRTMRDTMLRALEVADRFRLTLAFEPETNNVVDSVEKARQLIDEIQHPRLKVIIDPVNLLDGNPSCRRDDVLNNVFLLLGGEIVVAHAKDVLTYGYPTTPDKPALIDYGEYFRMLREISFSGALLIHSVAESQLANTVSFLKETAQQLGIRLR